MSNTAQARTRPWGRRNDPPEADAIRRTNAVADEIGRNADMNGTESDQEDGNNEQESGIVEQQNLHGTQRESLPDPAPSAGAIAEERALQLVANITTAAQGELRGLRDQLDDLMREMAERRAMITEAIRAHAEFAEASIQHKIIIGESIGKLRADFERSRSPLPPARNV